MKFFCTMNPKLLFTFFLFGIISTSTFAQTKVSGYVLDEDNQPISFANVIFKGSTQGTITDENGKFYMESADTWNALIVSFLGYETLDVPLTKKVNYELKFILKEAASELDQVFIVAGKQSKKNNPAIDLLRKIWEH
ncbi:MAG TPA: carboxypeptidase-like regulatory domain-containing protein, partial [Mariniflexile sp.]